jgi:hypothetical protein
VIPWEADTWRMRISPHRRLIVTLLVGALAVALLAAPGCGQSETGSEGPPAPRVTATLVGRSIAISYEIPTDESLPEARFMVLTARDSTPRGSPVGTTITLSGSTGRVTLLRPPSAGPYTLLASTLTSQGYRSAIVSVPVSASETAAPITR